MISVVFSTRQPGPRRALTPSRRPGRVKALALALLVAALFITFLIAAVVIGSILAAVVLIVLAVAFTAALFKAAVMR